MPRCPACGADLEVTLNNAEAVQAPPRFQSAGRCRDCAHPAHPFGPCGAGIDRGGDLIVCGCVAGVRAM